MCNFFFDMSIRRMFSLFLDISGMCGVTSCNADVSSVRDFSWVVYSYFLHIIPFDKFEI